MATSHRCLSAVQYGVALLLVAGLILDAGASGARDHGENTFGREPAAAGPQAVRIHRSSAPDTLMDIARHYGLGFVELRAANPDIDPWRAGEGREIVLPSLHLDPWSDHRSEGRRGIVINLADMRLYFYLGVGVPAVSFPIGIGRDGWETPTGETRIVLKRDKPTWIPPASIRARNPRLPAQDLPGPNNPLGDYALNLAWPRYVIHGTNKPDGVGRRISHGCIRLYPEDIERLFALVEVGTPVTVVDQPVKLARINGQLYLEIHPSQQQALEVELLGSFSSEPLPDLYRMIQHFPGVEGTEIDWSLAMQVARERRGIAVRISR
jgi:L,D-transpeptidase ErfK/SrfK